MKLLKLICDILRYIFNQQLVAQMSTIIPFLGSFHLPTDEKSFNLISLLEKFRVLDNKMLSYIVIKKYEIFSFEGKLIQFVPSTILSENVAIDVIPYLKFHEDESFDTHSATQIFI